MLDTGNKNTRRTMNESVAAVSRGCHTIRLNDYAPGPSYPSLSAVFLCFRGKLTSNSGARVVFMSSNGFARTPDLKGAKSNQYEELLEALCEQLGMP